MTRFRRDEAGMAMITIMLALSVLLTLAVAAIQYGLGSQNVSKRDQDWQSALSAAEAGLDNYQFHVNENANYIAYSASNPPPDGNLAFSQYVSIPGGNTIGPVPVHRRHLEGRRRRHHHGHDAPARSARSSGRCSRSCAAAASSTTCTSPTTRPRTRRPTPATPTPRSQAQNYCAHHYYDGRNSNCNDIQFISADTINGPVHSNDAILMCGSPDFTEHHVDELEHHRHPLAVGLWRHQPGLRQPG